jgi:hypothetical protein
MKKETPEEEELSKFKFKFRVYFQTPATADADVDAACCFMAHDARCNMHQENRKLQKTEGT